MVQERMDIKGDKVGRANKAVKVRLEEVEATAVMEAKLENSPSKEIIH